MSTKQTQIPIALQTVDASIEQHADQLKGGIVLFLDESPGSALAPKGLYYVNHVDIGDGEKCKHLVVTHLVSGEKTKLSRHDYIVTGIELPFDGDNSNLANVQSNKNLAEALDKSASWHSEAEGTVKQMVNTVLDEAATTVQLTDGVSVDLQVNGVREQLGSVLGIVSGLFSRSPLREMQ